MAFGHSDSDGRDFLIWQRNITADEPLAASTSVPEPATGSLLGGVLAVAGLRRK